MMCEVAQRFAGWLGLGAEHPGRARVRLRALGRTRVPGRRAATRSPCRCASCTWRGTSRSSSPPPGPDEARAVIERRAGAAYEPAARRARHAQLRRPPRRPGRRADLGAGDRERADPAACGSRATGSTPRSAPSRRSPASSRRGCASTRRAWPTSPRRPPGAWASRPTRSPSCGAPRSRTTSAGSACRTRSGRSRGRSGSASGSACGCTRTSPSAPSRSRRRSPRSGCWPARTTSGSTAPAITAARAGRRSIRPPASSPRRLLRGHARGAAVQAGARRRRRPRRSCCARPRRDGSTRTPSTPCSAPPATACRERPRELPAGLTERELEVLLVLVRGASNQAIADDLGISAKTVGHHIQHVYQKAGVRSRAAATRLGLRARPRSHAHRAFARCAAPAGRYSPHIGVEPRRRTEGGAR